MTTLVWFRADLRIHDHPALDHACATGDPVVAVYCLTPTTWEYHEAAPAKIDLIKRGLEALKVKLLGLNIPLFILDTKTYEATPALLLAFAKSHGVTDLYFNDQYEMDEQNRDRAVLETFLAADCKVFRFHDQLLMVPGLVLSGKGEPFKRFSAFKRKWLALLPSPLAGRRWCEALDEGERSEAQRCFETFLTAPIKTYHLTRNFPSIETSHLSPYLAQGMLSIRYIIQRLIDETKTASVAEILDQPGYGAWLNELIWREFYKHIIFNFPTIACPTELKARLKKWIWRVDDSLFQAWCEGQTGFPFIDAGMRQLNQTGWMHNRLRMNTAMFLAKLLRIDWRLGESYFSKHLIDGDLSANNGGWQWCAGTGTDAAPYHRIFNPTLQSERFDPNGEFIRRYCPELKDFSDQAIHAPHARDPERARSSGYPEPIIDYKQARQEFLCILQS